VRVDPVVALPLAVACLSSEDSTAISGAKFVSSFFLEVGTLLFVTRDLMSTASGKLVYYENSG